MKISALSLALAAVPATIPGLSVSAFGPAPSGRISTFARPSALFSTKLDQPTVAQPIFVAEKDDNDNTQIPSVTRANVKSTSIQPHATETEILNLPLGVRLTGGYKLRAEGLTGKGVRVAVIDTGVDDKHPGFKGQVTRKEWYRIGSLLSEDEYDHGTHVAGTIHMMAPDADIYDYRVFGEPGLTGCSENIAIAMAIKQAIKDGCQIINMSLGGPGQDDNIAMAVTAAHDKGVLMIVAAGNEGDDEGDDLRTNELSYPAMNNKTVSVAAVHKENGLRTASWSNTNDAVDYAGIGVDVISFEALSEGYMKMNGTSMASPHVCGFVTALMTKDGNYSDIITNDESLRILLDENFVRDIGEKGPNNSTGRGFLTYLNETEYDIMNETEYIDIW